MRNSYDSAGGTVLFIVHNVSQDTAESPDEDLQRSKHVGIFKGDICKIFTVTNHNMPMMCHQTLRNVLKCAFCYFLTLIRVKIMVYPFAPGYQ